MFQFQYLAFTLPSLDWNNPWVVGIGLAIFSLFLSILARMLSRRIFSRKDKEQYRLNIRAANQEIIHTLRLSIAESSIPPRKIVESLIRATGQSHGVKHEDIMTLTEFGDSLIKDVMDSNFISYQQKIKYSEEILEFSKTPPSSEAVTMYANTTYLANYEKRVTDRSINLIGVTTAVLGLIAAVAATVALSLENHPSEVSTVGPSIIIGVLAILVLSVIPPIATSFIDDGFSRFVSLLKSKIEIGFSLDSLEKTTDQPKRKTKK